MRIGQFTDSFYPTIGGTESVVIGLTKALQKNHDVFVAAPGSKKIQNPFDFKVYRVRAINAGTDLIALPDLACGTLKQIRKNPPEIIHCHGVNGMAVFARKVARKNIPVVFTVHTKFRDTYSSVIKWKWVVNMMLRNVAKKLSKADLVITVCEDMKRELASYGYKGPVTVVKNGGDFEIPSPALLQTARGEINTKYNIHEKDFVFIFVGRVVKVKNLEFTLNALEALKAKGINNFKFFIVGSGSDIKYFDELVVSKNLHDNVIFTGMISEKSEIAKLYAASDVVLFPSIFDNDSITMIEAALHKTPTIAIKGTGSSERITDGKNGFIIENDLNAYVSKIEYLMQNPTLLKKAGEEASKTDYSWNTVSEKYLEIYKEVINKKKESLKNKQ